jgi:ubiquinone/menaquinone biosynthesis C-methylase UbiE
MPKDTPPICNYEGSDYQTSFWEEGGRAYEDAVEEVALRRLLPRGGRLMLELGAGAGRNTRRYAAFERVVLVDYSRTQLEQARARLGDEPRYLYAAADIYRLPFVNGLFDAATMIRTLHHMAEPQKALEQVRAVMAGGAAFILEYANKHNLKAMLRYALRRQDWSPYDRQAVEFAALNFDFHPASVEGWLAASGFRTRRRLSVSHFRHPVFKKLPLSLLVKMDAAAQLTGDWWQVSPSVFVLAEAVGGKVEGAVGFFKCLECGVGIPEPQKDEAAVCPQCGHTWPCEGGIYDFRVE